MGIDNNIIIFDKVSAIYKNGVGIFDISFQLKRGEFIFLMGPTGSGKSTILRSIYMDLKINKGEILYKGNDLSRIRKRQIPKLRRNMKKALQKEVDSYKPFKDKYDTLDGQIRGEALGRLPESKQEKFKNLSTTDLLNVVDELSVKPNPPDGAGTVDTKISKDVWKNMDMKERRSNWSAILDSYKR